MRGTSPAAVERHLCGIEQRRPHVDRHFARCREPRLDHAGQRFDADGGLVGQPLVAHEAHEAARTVAALLDFAAVGVEDAVAEVDAGPLRRLDHQDLVGTDTEAAVRQAPQLVGRQRELLSAWH